ncbi:hypothetical protein PVAP13_7NG106456 [Panicum virgatum]|uniref:Uncharacterized protein n=1 Tax=Panicum virgatum TaxID=38727 RepID=A0A8T0PQ30_PANVG|nr:hypothetical protein PVAP13_7NG106456 [Panicum virgatum]
MHLDAYFWFIYTCEERRRASTSSAPPLPLCFPCRLAPHRRPSSSPSPSTRLRREEEPQRLDPGAAASIPCEKGEGSGDIYSQLSLSLSLSASCGDSSVELLHQDGRSALGLGSTYALK